MRAAHAFAVPDAEMVIDLQSFVAYLATEIREWHECLYCGAVKPSTASTQSHMRDKRHCRLNIDREPELQEFWEARACGAAGITPPPLQRGTPTNTAATEMRFPSGKVIESRHAAPTIQKSCRKRSPVASSTVAVLPPAHGDEVSESESPVAGQQQVPGRQLARREEMGIAGVSVQQRQALVLAEKKAQRSEAAAHRAREWIYAEAANSQKYDLLGNKMDVGKRNHKLLPR